MNVAPQEPYLIAQLFVAVQRVRQLAEQQLNRRYQTLLHKKSHRGGINIFNLQVLYGRAFPSWGRRHQLLFYRSAEGSYTILQKP